MNTILRGCGSLLLAAITASSACGDAGTVRVSETFGHCRITVFTSPTPLRAGPVEVSVLVQDVASGTTVTDAQIEIITRPTDGDGRTLRQFASPDSAANKLLQAVAFDLTEPGSRQFEIVIHRPHEAVQSVRFAAGIAPPLPRWVRFWPWFTWPVAAVALFVLRQRLASRSGKIVR